MSFHPLMPYGEGWHKSDRVVAAEGPPFAFTSDRAQKLEEICGRYPPERRKSAVLAALYFVQEQQGYLTANAMRHVAEFLRITPADQTNSVPGEAHRRRRCALIACDVERPLRMPNQKRQAQAAPERQREAPGPRFHRTTAFTRCMLEPALRLRECQMRPLSSIDQAGVPRLRRELAQAFAKRR